MSSSDSPINPTPSSPAPQMPKKGGSHDKVIIGVVIAMVLAGGVVGAIGATSGRSHTDVTTQSQTAVQPSTRDSATSTGDVKADDGELHSGWDASYGYSYTDESYDHDQVDTMDAFDGAQVKNEFHVKYPQLSGDLANLDTINAAIRDQAMLTVTSSYLEPDESARSSYDLACKLSDDAMEYSGIPDGCAALFSSDVTYAITYNSDKLVSIVFSDDCSQGSWYGQYLVARTINVNLETGEVYSSSDLLTVNDDIANDWIDNYVANVDDGGELLFKTITRDELVQALEGKGDSASRYFVRVFVDGNGKVNIAVTYMAGGNGNILRGWWDVTLTDDEVAAAKTDSSFWDLLPSS